MKHTQKLAVRKGQTRVTITVEYADIDECMEIFNGLESSLAAMTSLTLFLKSGGKHHV